MREIHLRPGRCVVFNDTVIARAAGDFAIETRFRTPARFVLQGREAQSWRCSPGVGEVMFRIESLCAAAQLTIVEDPIYLRYKKESERALWRKRYLTDDVVLTALVARRALYLEVGEAVRLTHLAQLCGPGEGQVHLVERADGVCIFHRRDFAAFESPGGKEAAKAQTG